MQKVLLGGVAYTRAFTLIIDILGASLKELVKVVFVFKSVDERIYLKF